MNRRRGISWKSHLAVVSVGNLQPRGPDSSSCEDQWARLIPRRLRINPKIHRHMWKVRIGPLRESRSILGFACWMESTSIHYRLSTVDVSSPSHAQAQHIEGLGFRHIQFQLRRSVVNVLGLELQKSRWGNPAENPRRTTHHTVAAVRHLYMLALQKFRVDCAKCVSDDETLTHSFCKPKKWYKGV